MGYSGGTITAAAVLAALTSDSTQLVGADVNTLTSYLNAAAILAAVTSDNTKLTGTAIARQITGSTVFVWTAAKQTLNDFNAIAGTWAAGADSNVWSNKYLGNAATHAVNDAVCLGYVFIPVDGTYSVYGHFRRSGAYGKAHFLLNNSDKGNIDCYGGSDDDNYNTSVSLGALTRGLYCFTLKVSDKNAAGSDYHMHVHTLAIVLA